MADPAAEAARRQLTAQFGRDFGEDDFYTVRVRTEAAREALKPIQAKFREWDAAYSGHVGNPAIHRLLDEMEPLIFPSQETEHG